MRTLGRGGLSLSAVGWAFSSLNAGVSYWHPLTWLAHQLDCQLFGLRPGPHHLTNVWLHVFDTLLLFAALRRLNSSVSVSFFVAGLFALHPLHVESVGWVAERKDVLYGFFWLWALLSHIRFRERGAYSWYMASLLFFCCALMSKPTAITLPVVLLLLETVWWTKATRNVPSSGNVRGQQESPSTCGRLWVLIPFFASP